MTSGTGGEGGRGKEARLSGAPGHCPAPTGPAAAASQPLSRRNAQRGNPNTKVRMDGRAAFPCDCGPTREGMHTAHPTRVSARIKGADGPQSQGGRKSRRSSDRLKFQRGGGGREPWKYQQHAKRGDKRQSVSLIDPNHRLSSFFPVFPPESWRQFLLVHTPKKDRQLRIASPCFYFPFFIPVSCQVLTCALRRNRSFILAG